MDKEIKIDLRRCFIALLSKCWIIAIIGIVSFGITLLFTSKRGVDSYYAKATVYSAVSGSYQESLQAGTAMRTYAEIITSSKVAERAAAIIGDSSITSQEIQGAVSVNYSSSSMVMTISSYSLDSDKAVMIANAVASAFVMEVQDITGGDSVQLLDEAVASFKYNDTSSTNQKIRLYATCGSILLAAAVIVFAEIFSKRIHSVDEATANGQLEILGVIPLK